MNKNLQRVQRKTRTRSHIKGTKDMPRLTVFRSNRFLYAQLIDDDKGITLLGISEKHLDKKKETKVAVAKTLGLTLAKAAKEKKIAKVVFDRGSYRYHGRVKAFAEGAREGGLEF